MDIICKMCGNDLSSLEGSFFVNEDELKTDNYVTDLTLLCHTCEETQKGNMIKLVDLQHFYEKGKAFVQEAKREDETNTRKWDYLVLHTLEEALFNMENIFWNESANYVHQRIPFWEYSGHLSEDEYYQIETGGSKSFTFTEDVSDIIHYKYYLRLFQQVARRKGQLEGPSEGVRSRTLAQALADVERENEMLMEEVSEWLQRVRIPKDDSNHYDYLIYLICQEYEDVESYRKTLEESLYDIQELIARYFKHFEQAEIDLDYVRKQQKKEKEERASGHWMD